MTASTVTNFKRTIKGYPLPDYKYCGKKSITNYPVIDSQNLEEYRKEIEATGGVIDPTSGQNDQLGGQNDQLGGQNDRDLKEKKQKKNNYNIYTKTLKREVEEGQKPTTATTFKNNFEKDIVPPPTTLQEVLDYAREKQPGISQEVVRDFFVYYSAKGWRYKGNGLVRNWKAELFLFDQRGKRWEKEKAIKTIAKVQAGVSPAYLAMEEEMREQRRREREKAEREADTPEAKAAAEAFFDKYCKK